MPARRAAASGVRDPGKACSDRLRLIAAQHIISVDPDEWAILRRVIDLIQANAKGAELGPVLETIENALRADQAKMIEGE